MPETVVLITATGAGSILVPANVTTAKVECWGGGGTSPANATNGGGGGAYSCLNALAVTPGATLNYSVGIGGYDNGGVGVDGADTWFSSTSTVRAKGGRSGSAGSWQGGLASGGVGDVKYSGGSGDAMKFGAGASASPFGNGGDAVGDYGGGNSPGAGAGGSTYNVAGASDVNGGGGGGFMKEGGAPGGGSTNGYYGGRGQIRITWTEAASEPDPTPTDVLNDTFTGTTDDLLKNRSGWQLLTGSSATTSHQDQAKIWFNQMQVSGSNYSLASSVGWGRSNAGADHGFEVSCTGQAGTQIFTLRNSTMGTSYSGVQITMAQYGTLRIQTRNAGTLVLNQEVTHSRTWTTGDKLRVQHLNNTIKLWITNGGQEYQVGPTGGYDVSGLPAGNGVGITNLDNAIYDNFRIYTLGAVALTATLSKSLGAMTAASSGSVAWPVRTATMAGALGAAVLASAAGVALTAQSNPSLGAMSASGAATVVTPAREGSLSAQLGGMTAASDAVVSVNAASYPTLGSLNLSSAGTVAYAPREAVSAITLGNATLASQTKVEVNGGTPASFQNFATYSTDLSHASWATFGSMTKTANAAQAPDGTTRAARIQLDVTNEQALQKSVSSVGRTGKTHTVSIWARTHSGTQTIALRSGQSGASKLFSINTTWQRLTWTTTSTGYTTEIVQVTNGSLIPGASATVDAYVWGLQVEQGSNASDLIETQAASVATGGISTASLSVSSNATAIAGLTFTRSFAALSATSTASAIAGASAQPSFGAASATSQATVGVNGAGVITFGGMIAGTEDVAMDSFSDWLHSYVLIEQTHPAPDGTNTACRVETIEGPYNFLAAQHVGAGSEHTIFTIRVKGETGAPLRYGFYSATRLEDVFFATFDLQAGVVTGTTGVGSVYVTSLVDGWYQLDIRAHIPEGETINIYAGHLGGLTLPSISYVWKPELRKGIAADVYVTSLGIAYLGETTLDAEGSVLVQAQLEQTLEGMSITARTGAEGFVDFAQPLGGMMAASEGQVDVVGALAATLEGLAVQTIAEAAVQGQTGVEPGGLALQGSARVIAATRLVASLESLTASSTASAETTARVVPTFAGMRVFSLASQLIELTAHPDRTITAKAENRTVSAPAEPRLMRAANEPRIKRSQREPRLAS